MLRNPGDDAHWIDDEGRAYGFMRDDYSRALWTRGAMDADEAHLWVLLPKARSRAKVGEIVIFPLPDDRIDLHPYLHPDSHARARVRVTRYLHRPRRQRAAAIVASIENFGEIDAPTGRELTKLIDDDETEPRFQSSPTLAT